MQLVHRVITITLATLLLALLSGCTIDPMERLSERIKSQKVEEREEAVKQLANLNDERTIEALIEVLESDDELSDKAGVALVKKGREVQEPDPKKPNPVVDEVGKVLKNAHLAESFRSRAAWVLGEIGDRRAIPALQAGQTALIGEKAAAGVRENSKQGLEKLGFFSDGRAFDYEMGRFVGPIEILPVPPKLPTG